MDNQGDVLSLMQRLQTLPDRYKVSDLLDLFNNDAQFQIMTIQPSSERKQSGRPSNMMPQPTRNFGLSTCCLTETDLPAS